MSKSQFLRIMLAIIVVIAVGYLGQWIFRSSRPMWFWVFCGVTFILGFLVPSKFFNK